MLTPPRLAPAPASPPPRRHIAVHPTLPYCLTCSDDMLIKLWDWDKGWACTQVFEGHSHYVMQLVFNPKGAVWVQYGGGSETPTVVVQVGAPASQASLAVCWGREGERRKKDWALVGSSDCRQVRVFRQSAPPPHIRALACF